jgi:hypothetical protein
VNQRYKGLIHFAIAALLVCGSLLVKGIVAEPIAWPAPVAVDQNNGFVLTSLPEAFAGRYELAEAPPKGEPGTLAVNEDTKETLHIGGPVDKERFSQRKSNWMYSAYYYDSTFDGLVKKPRRYKELTQGAEAAGLWRLDVYYYTGLADAIPHVPEICGRAGGLTVMQDQCGDVNFKLPQPVWLSSSEKAASSVTFHKTQLESTAFDSHYKLEYYVLMVNGAPYTDRQVARVALAKDLVLGRKHVYYAKIQFAPIVVTDPALAQEAAGEFVKAFLPQVLKMLPSAQDVKDVNSSAKK